MNGSHLWAAEPHAAYAQWQTTEAAGADRRRFSQRSIVQHKAMFDRFLRHLGTRGVALATFGPEHLESFFGDVENRCAPGTTTRLRYVKLIDRLSRHLVDIGLRESNPAAPFALSAAWPEDEPEPLFLDPAADAALQAYAQPDAGDDARLCRNRAVVALLLGAGLTAAELRGACWRDIVIDGIRPQVRIPKRGARLERTVALPPFSTPPLAAWQRAHPASDGTLLFPAPRTGDKPINDVLLGAIVREALEAIGFAAVDMSPRVLRNTFARRQLLSGRTNEQTSALLGLASQRTVTRLRATITAPTT
ncbi:site-specific recombinase XerD [Paraburkholderia sp. BL6669N2]|uniref:tyrosine-type recombinase/integrase n=1 Tax=Paraburkholderia sp. BL6669N2 TaxID=1938807 RepID=UPI000E260ACB|nr:site-specific integrase [Paraburkholderia sp. BL6669N2]REG45539.1 site-specific recombinase XerD [Paraburkholderia sp. BL6669N2]